MKIKIGDEVSEIYGVYWYPHKTILFSLPPWCQGSAVYDLNEVDILDPSITSRWVLLTGDYTTGLYHWALIEMKLLDGLNERVTEDVIKFLEILRDEGHEREDYRRIENYYLYNVHKK